MQNRSFYALKRASLYNPKRFGGLIICWEVSRVLIVFSELKKKKIKNLGAIIHVRFAMLAILVHLS